MTLLLGNFFHARLLLTDCCNGKKGLPQLTSGPSLCFCRFSTSQEQSSHEEGILILGFLLFYRIRIFDVFLPNCVKRRFVAIFERTKLHTFQAFFFILSRAPRKLIEASQPSTTKNIAINQRRPRRERCEKTSCAPPQICSFSQERV